MRDRPVHKLMQAGFLNRCKEFGIECNMVGNSSATAFDVVNTATPISPSVQRRGTESG